MIMMKMMALLKIFGISSLKTQTFIFLKKPKKMQLLLVVSSVWMVLKKEESGSVIVIGLSSIITDSGELLLFMREK